MRLPALLVAGALLLGAAACGTGAAADDARPHVVAAFYPLQFLAQRIGGAGVRVEGLTRPGAEPHDLELSPQQVGDVSVADLVVYLRGFQPAVDAAVKDEAAGRALDVGTVTPLVAGDDETGNDTGGDPHVWLDPGRMRTLATAVADRLAAALPGQAPGIRDRARALDAELAALDADFHTGLARCARTDIVTSHTAFGYLARAYGLTQVGITGLVPENEPTPRRLADVAAYARAHDVTTVFFEDTVSPKTAQALAREVGARAEVLSPLESRPADGGDYVSGMRADLATLRTALGCT